MAESFHPTSDLEGQKAQGHYSDNSDTATASGRKPPKKWQLAWFYLFSLCGLGLTLALSFSCSSVATSSLPIYSIRPAKLIQPEHPPDNVVGDWTDSLAEWNRDPSSNQYLPSNSTTQRFSPEDFSLQTLPDRYLFGISGLCRQWSGSAENNNNNTHITCTRHFPQVPSLLQAILEDADTATARDSWRRLLTSHNTETEPQVAQWQRLVRAAAAMLILSIFWAVALIGFTALKPEFFHWTFYLAIVDAVLALTAAVLWTVVGNLQSRPLQAVMLEMTGRDSVKIVEQGLAIGLLWALVLCKLVVTPLMALIVFLVALALVWCCCCVVAGGGESDREKKKKEEEERARRDNYPYGQQLGTGPEHSTNTSRS